MREEIVASMARTLYVTAWADSEEEKGRSNSGELMDIAPPTSRWAERYAKRLAKRIEADNGAALDVLYERARLLTEAPDGMRSARRDPSADLFGHYLVMQALGSGVAWSDDYPDHNLKLPYIECSMHYQTSV